MDQNVAHRQAGNQYTKGLPCYRSEANSFQRHQPFRVTVEHEFSATTKKNGIWRRTNRLCAGRRRHQQHEHADNSGKRRCHFQSSKAVGEEEHRRRDRDAGKEQPERSSASNSPSDHRSDKRGQSNSNAHKGSKLSAYGLQRLPSARGRYSGRRRRAIHHVDNPSTRETVLKIADPLLTNRCRIPSPHTAANGARQPHASPARLAPPAAGGQVAAPVVHQPAAALEQV